jgi:hypothetical protein
MSEQEVRRIIDEAYPPGSEERERLDAAAEAAKRLLAEHGYGHLLESSRQDDE